MPIQILKPNGKWFTTSFKSFNEVLEYGEILIKHSENIIVVLKNTFKPEVYKKGG